ncbi:hypothetical protein OM076_22450 [Solirubrobacter ginsenosidimutans]|uniref:Uncharacterized protein n=1 Tax=Solirubrobacter ginsenosidimutans TaxID=490573 RepID=A0A9X3S4G7_9ACTN|nr:hypothetical protein [Solirubrobacter ginsenosidimutans]MDA0163051.1 hypothetical protein [Solirubrobacter ginsenosidimutans]
MLTPTAPASTGSRMAATARRYDAATARIATPVTRRVAPDVADATKPDPAGYGANAAVSLTAEAARGSLVDVLA